MWFGVDRGGPTKRPIGRLRALTKLQAAVSY
jgi:hypothetical protein